MDEGTGMPSVFPHRTLVSTCAIGELYGRNFFDGMTCGSFFFLIS